MLAMAVSIPAAVSTTAASAATPVPPLHTFVSVSCVSATDCVAVGNNGTGPLAERWNGTKWSVTAMHFPVTAKGGGYLYGVSCGAPKSCVAVGWYYRSGTGAALPLAESWNGASWSVATVPVPKGSGGALPFGVACTSAKSCFLVGYYLRVPGNYNTSTPLIESWNGTKWTLAAAGGTGSPAGLSGLSCWSPGRCIAVGYSGQQQLVESWNGLRWVSVKVPAPAGPSASLNAVSCTSATSCVAVGRSIVPSTGSWTAYAEILKGTKWTVSRPPVPAGSQNFRVYPRGVSCTSTTWCVVVGEFGGAGSDIGTSYAQAWNGTAWKPLIVPAVPGVSAGNGSVLGGVRCFSAKSCVAAGQYGLDNGGGWAYSALWNGKVWKLVKAV
jgi:hypothetical protein